MSRIRWYGPTLLLVATVLSVMIAGPSIAREMAYSYQSQNIQLVRESLAANPVLDELSRSFRQIATVVEPSVVHIQVSVKGRNPRMMQQGPGPIDPDRLREWFYRRDRGPAPQERPQQNPGQQNPGQQDLEQYNPAIPSGNGSGWVYDDQGHIVTNNHVVAQADVITVRFFDGTEHTATVIGADPKTDIAVLKINSAKLHPAIVAREPVQQGDIVFAFGSPFGFKFSMSQGIVSAVGRNELGIIRGGYEDFIQTDAAINPGNSGGPLTNIHGQVVGMNTAIASRTGANNGLGFAIPASTITHVVDSLIKSGKVTRGFLGVQINDLDPRMARTFNYDGKGVLVVNAIPGTPGAQAGLQAGDIITSLDGQPMTSADLLRNTVAATQPGTVVNLGVFRDGTPISVKVTVGLLPDEVAQAQRPTSPDANATPDTNEQMFQQLSRLGIERLVPLTPELLQRYQITGINKGILVQAVRPGSSAAVSGIVPGVIITDIMGAPVGTLDELATELGKHDLTQGIRVRVFADDSHYFVLLQLEKQ